MKRSALAAVVTGSLMVSILTLCVSVVEEEEGTPVRTVRIEAGELSVVFRDNAQSPKLLSGIASLRSVRHAPEYDAYDPDNPAASAGLNFEHVISGHPNHNNSFTPRHGRYDLYRLPDGKSVKLVRRAEDSPWKVASTLTYTVRQPHYVDFEFHCVPEDASLFGERGYAIFFFANYMNDVEEVALHFLGIAEDGGEEQWIAADAPEGHPHWRGGGNYRSLPAQDLEYDPDVQFRLNTWSYDWPSYSQPFYYGRAAYGMTLILMFDRMYSERDQIRFSLYKFKLNRYPRPAWDFQYVINRVESGQQYGFRGRLVFKKFRDPEDVRMEYESWASGLASGGVREKN